jgi:hypothetical protein
MRVRRLRSPLVLTGAQARQIYWVCGLDTPICTGHDKAGVSEVSSWKDFSIAAQLSVLLNVRNTDEEQRGENSGTAWHQQGLPQSCGLF